MDKQTRTTKQRSLMLAKLQETCGHPTADELYSITREALPHLSLGTVYRNLELLARQGKVRCIENAGFQKRFDANLMPHHHVRCTRCGRVGDVETDMPRPDIKAARAEGFTLTGAEIFFEGVCSMCKT